MGFDAAYALTSPPGGDGVSDQRSYGVGFAVSKKNVVHEGDRLGVAVSKPLLAYPESAAGTDASGASTGSPRVGLSPGGSETDFSIIYATPLNPTTTGVVSLAARQDADNEPGQHDVAAMVRIKHNF
jgi:hypothetical protein